MKKNITWHLGIIIVSVVFVSMIITSVSNYWVSYKKTYEAAGIEAVGCANITTGLIVPSDIVAIINGNEEILKELEQTLDWTTEHKQIFEDQYLIMLDGTILAADSNLKKQGFKAGDKFYIDSHAMKMILETKHPHYSKIYEYGGVKRLTGYAPIFKDHDPTKEIIALNAIDFDAKIVSERTWESVVGSFMLGLMPMAIASFLTIWMIRRKIKPITVLIEYANKIADGDLSVKNIQIKHGDEIGDLTDNLNFMKNNLRDLIHMVNSSAVQVAASSEELTANAEQTNYATEQISITMQQMSKKVDKQVESVEETTLTAHEMSKGAQQIANHAQSVYFTALVASDKATEGGQSIETAVHQMNMINDTVKGLASVVRGLGDRSNAIGNIIGVITNIAEQTNLLSLNAAIEAARAGEQGRGFAIVADEVRKLAELSSQSAKEISELISATQQETTHAVLLMEHASNEVLEGIGAVHTAGESFVQIQNSVNEVTVQIQLVSSAVHQMASGAEEMVQTMQFILEVAETTSSNTQEVTSSTEEQLASMQEIASSTNYLSKLAEELQRQIHKFKL
ncbi:methyl-accepting chemotaxis protein [Peribacillus acanthi]|uniref:methyl-accepting chemotaxis protein n=1 Tax=Peribacillus acanthi TaxID=2171554 RepID=UPI000D3E4D06|nr:HAMP domain-containing methyl-accepting chemotaxis protein [Peribacillus acanthi]